MNDLRPQQQLGDRLLTLGRESEATRGGLSEIETQKNGQPGSVSRDRGEVGQRRPWTRLAEEIATYRARLSEMAKEHEGEFALIKGTEIVRFFPDDLSALREGQRRFGSVPSSSSELPPMSEPFTSLTWR